MYKYFHVDVFLLQLYIKGCLFNRFSQFFDFWAEIHQILRWFFGKLKKPKSHVAFKTWWGHLYMLGINLVWTCPHAHRRAWSF
jgi:hypothetical protein